MTKISTILKKEMRIQGISVRVLSRAVGIAPSTLQYIRDGGGCKTSTFLRIFKELGLEVWVEKDGEGTKLV